MKKLTPILLIALASCAINKNYQAKVGLQYSGSYTIRSVQGKDVTFKEFPGTVYTVNSDTLKTGDKITINMVRKNRIAFNPIVRN